MIKRSVSLFSVLEITFQGKQDCSAPMTAFFNNVDPQRIDGDHFFRKESRSDPRKVAHAGVELMVRGGLTRVVGTANRLMILGNRLVPRAMVAAITKRMLRPAPVKSSMI